MCHTKKNYSFLSHRGTLPQQNEKSYKSYTQSIMHASSIFFVFESETLDFTSPEKNIQFALGKFSNMQKPICIRPFAHSAHSQAHRKVSQAFNRCYSIVYDVSPLQVPGQDMSSVPQRAVFLIEKIRRFAESAAVCMQCPAVAAGGGRWSICAVAILRNGLYRAGKRSCCAIGWSEHFAFLCHKKHPATCMCRPHHP